MKAINSNSRIFLTGLQMVEATKNPRVLICAAGEGAGKVVFTPSLQVRPVHAARKTQSLIAVCGSKSVIISAAEGYRV